MMMLLVVLVMMVMVILLLSVLRLLLLLLLLLGIRVLRIKHRGRSHVRSNRNRRWSLLLQESLLMLHRLRTAAAVCNRHFRTWRGRRRWTAGWRGRVHVVAHDPLARRQESDGVGA